MMLNDAAVNSVATSQNHDIAKTADRTTPHHTAQLDRTTGLNRALLSYSLINRLVHCSNEFK